EPRIGDAVAVDAAGGIHVDAGAEGIAAGAEGGVGHPGRELAGGGQAGRAEQQRATEERDEGPPRAALLSRGHHWHLPPRGPRARPRRRAPAVPPPGTAPSGPR